MFVLSKIFKYFKKKNFIYFCFVKKELKQKTIKTTYEDIY
jgi:hypothetical protein